eukprot:6090373-Ditylum_brightwellii.AAC.1
MNYMFVASALLPAIFAAGFLPFKTLFLSDHSALCADVNSELHFLGDQNDLTESTEHNIFQQVQTLHDDLMTKQTSLLS